MSRPQADSGAVNRQGISATGTISHADNRVVDEGKGDTSMIRAPLTFALTSVTRVNDQSSAARVLFITRRCERPSQPIDSSEV